MASKLHVSGPLPSHDHTHTIIFLHGKGSDGDEFSSELFESEISSHLIPQGNESRTLQAQFPSIRCVFPTAPLLRSERFGCVEHQWFDMWAVENPEECFQSQIEGLEQSVSLIREVIAAEEAILCREKIFLAGISQGFATVITAALLMGGSFAGLIGLCTWMPVGAYETIARKAPVGIEIGPTCLRAPVFLGHSKDDGVVPINNGRILRRYLAGYSTLSMEWHEYDSEDHWIVEPNGVDDMVEFIKANMKQN